MHKFAEKIAECLKAKVEGMGIDNINGQDLVEFELWSKIIKNLVCYDKDKKIIEAMDEAEEAEEAMKYIEMYEHYPEDDRKGYRGQPRDDRGRYMSRRGYETPMMMYDDMDYESMEHMRDMDRPYGRMGYAGSGSYGGSSQSGRSSSGMNGGQSNMGNSGSSSSGGNRGYSDGNQSEGRRDSREGRSGQSRRGYMESKEMGKDKQEKIKELENYTKELAEDVTEMISGASPEEKTLLKTKMQTLIQKIQ